MDSLLKPDIGLMFWTIVNFLILVFLLAKFAWKPLLKSLQDREDKISKDVTSAQQARQDAQKIQQELETRLENLAKESSAKLKEAAALGDKEREAILSSAKEEARTLISQARADIKIETEKAVEAVKKEVIDTTMLAVKKVIGKEADAKTDARLVEDLLKDMKVK